MGWLGPLIAHAVGGGLFSIAGSLMGRFMVAAGVGVVSYIGADLTLTFFKDEAVGAFSSLPAAIVGLLSVMKVGQCVSMVFSAMLMRMTLTGLSGGALKRFVAK